jgi:hypothetical protein
MTVTATAKRRRPQAVSHHGPREIPQAKIPALRRSKPHEIWHVTALRMRNDQNNQSSQK